MLDGALRTRNRARPRGALAAWLGVRTLRDASAARLACQHPFERTQQPPRGKRLLDKVSRAQTGGSNRVLNIRMSRDHDHMDLGFLGLDSPQELKPVELRHPDIQQHDGRFFPRDNFHYAGRVPGVDDAKTLVAQESAK